MQKYFSIVCICSLVLMSMIQEGSLQYAFCPLRRPDSDNCQPCATDSECEAGTKCCFKQSCCMPSSLCSPEGFMEECTVCVQNKTCEQKGMICCNKLQSGCCSELVEVPLVKPRNDMETFCVMSSARAKLTISEEAYFLTCSDSSSCNVITSDIDPPNKNTDPPNKLTDPPTKDTDPPNKNTDPPNKDTDPPHKDTDPTNKLTDPTETTTATNPACSNIPPSPSNTCLSCNTNSDCLGGGVCCQVSQIGKTCCIYNGR